MKNKIYVNYGCGLAAPLEWLNFDASPTLRIQKTPLMGRLLKRKLNILFPENVRYGNIIKGLPLEENSVDGIYCSHTLEHLSLLDFRKALRNTIKVMKKGAKFRCIVPDLEFLAREYISKLDKGVESSSIEFMNNTLLGANHRPKGLRAILSVILGNSNHLWMWDRNSLALELEKTGFKKIRICQFNDSNDDMFKLVEDLGRFKNAVAIECEK